MLFEIIERVDLVLGVVVSLLTICQFWFGGKG